MAKNTGENHRVGSVKDRTQFEHPSNSDHSLKRDAETGEIMSGKEGDYKGVAHEKHKRRE